MTRILTLSILFNFLIQGAIAQSSGTALADGTETASMNFDTNEYQIKFSIAADDVKSAFMAKSKNYQYTVELAFVDARECGSKSIANWQDVYGESSLSAMGSSGDPMVLTFDGDDINGAIEREFEQCGWASSGSVALNLIVPNKKRAMMTISQVLLSIPSNAQSVSLSSSSGEILKLFKTGLVNNDVYYNSLAQAVESYMENKWPSENITTVHLTDQQYQNPAKMAFKIDGYYITRKGSTCKYNSFYGDVKSTNSGYSITFFNSTDAETTIDCGVADQLQNM